MGRSLTSVQSGQVSHWFVPVLRFLYAWQALVVAAAFCGEVLVRRFSTVGKERERGWSTSPYERLSTSPRYQIVESRLLLHAFGFPMGWMWLKQFA